MAIGVAKLDIKDIRERPGIDGGAVGRSKAFFIRSMRLFRHCTQYSLISALVGKLQDRCRRLIHDFVKRGEI